jgi:hypothetical protein
MPSTLAESFIPELPGHYRGKVRENYDLRDATRILIATARVKARSHRDLVTLVGPGRHQRRRSCSRPQ